MTQALPDPLPEDLLAREARLRAGGARPGCATPPPPSACPRRRSSRPAAPAGTARRLRRPTGREGFGALLARLPEAGEVMALTRNEACVHEKHGAFAPPAIEGAMGQVVGEIDLRLFLRHWRFGYLLDEETRSGPRRSLQFFDAGGTAIHKVYATPATDAAAFARIAADFADPERRPAAFEPAAPAAARPDAEIDVAGLLAAWAGLKHTHEFALLLRRFGVTRAQAMRLVPEFARPVAAAPRTGSSPPSPRAASRSWSSSATAAACRSTPARSTASSWSAPGSTSSTRASTSTCAGPRRRGGGGAQALGDGRHPRARALRGLGRDRRAVLRHPPTPGRREP